MFVDKTCIVILPLVFLQVRTQAYNAVNSLIEQTITASINNSAEPCNDFYSYACGNYEEQHDTDSFKEIIGQLDYQYNIKVLNLMDSNYHEDHQPDEECQSFVEKTKRYLEACRAQVNKNITKYFDEIKPGPLLEWPLIEQLRGNAESPEQWPYDKDFDVWTLLGKLQSYGLTNVLLNQEIQINSDGELTIALEPATSEGNSTLPDPDILHLSLVAMGIQNPEEVVYDILSTDENLLYPHYEAEEETSRDMKLGDLEKHFPNLNLNAYLSELLGRQLPPDTSILVKDPDYFQYLSEKPWQIFEKKSLCNYLMMKFIFYLATDSTSEFSRMACVNDLRNKFDLSVNFLYYHHIYAFEAQNVNSDVETIFTNIKGELKRIFETNCLNLTSLQVKLLLEKLSNVKFNLGNLPDRATFHKIEEFYRDVPSLDKNNYQRNHLLMLQHRFAKSLLSSQHQTHFIVTDNKLGSSSGPFYVGKQNMIVLPFGSLQPPMYDFLYHDLYKYSLLGFVLAHELTHAFDTSGLTFDGHGQEASMDMTAILENKRFENSIECLQSQLPTENIEERIADIVAMRLVYAAYMSKPHCLKPTKRNGNWKKLFYLNMAQFFCGKENIKFLDHDTDAERLNQIAMNSWNFANAFKCPVNSEMNPCVKCRLY